MQWRSRCNFSVTSPVNSSQALLQSYLWSWKLACSARDNYGKACPFPAQGWPMSGSRWWFGIAMYPIGGILIWAIGLSLIITESVPVLFGVSKSTIWVAFWMTGFLGLLTPLFLFLDAKSLQNTDWSPDPVVYFTIGLISFLIPPLMLGVALRYLYLRHKNIGLTMDSTVSRE